MKKTELEELLNETRRELSEANRKLYAAENSNKHLESELERMNVLAEKEENDYKMWKTLNGKFMSRFMDEYIREHVSVRVECEINYVTVDLMLDGEVISSETDNISVSRTCRCDY